MGLGMATFPALHKLINIWDIWRPIRPTCKKFKCSSNGYKLIELSNTGAVFHCRCVTKYLKKNRCFTDTLSKYDTYSEIREWDVFGVIKLKNRYDHIMLSKGLDCVGARMTKVEASDHIPALAVVTCKNEF